MRITSTANDIPIEVRLCEKDFLSLNDQEAFEYITTLSGKRQMAESKQREPKEPKEPKEKVESMLRGGRKGIEL